MYASQATHTWSPDGSDHHLPIDAALMKMADVVLYRAGQLGRNRVDVADAGMVT